MIAKIPLPLSRHIAAVYRPQSIGYEWVDGDEYDELAQNNIVRA